MKRQLTGLEVVADQQVMPREAVASHDQAYQRLPLEPFPAERTSGCRLAVSMLAVSAQVNFFPLARVSRKFEGNPEHVGLAASKNSRSWVQLP